MTDLTKLTLKAALDGLSAKPRKALKLHDRIDKLHRGPERFGSRYPQIGHVPGLLQLFHMLARVGAHLFEIVEQSGFDTQQAAGLSERLELPENIGGKGLELAGQHLGRPGALQYELGDRRVVDLRHVCNPIA